MDKGEKQMKRNPCNTCLWWLRKNKGWGDCHSNPPQIIVSKNGQHSTRFPQTQGNSFCGDWEEREPSVSEISYD